LKIYDENLEKEYSKEEIEKIIYFTILDSTRTIERMTQPEFLKYTILMKAILIPLFESGLVRVENDKLLLDSTKENFSLFLNTLKELLFTIQDMYNLDPETLQKIEQPILEQLDNNAGKYIDYIAQKMND
jgi:hypothetical protein